MQDGPIERVHNQDDCVLLGTSSHEMSKMPASIVGILTHLPSGHRCGRMTGQIEFARHA